MVVRGVCREVAEEGVEVVEGRVSRGGREKYLPKITDKQTSRELDLHCGPIKL